MRTQVINSNSLVLTEELGGNCSVQVHIDRLGSRVNQSDVTFWIGDKPFDGGPCPARPGENWEAGLKKVTWWLSGNVKYRANIVLPKHGYSAMYCTNQPGCNCENHAS
ncbi:hypothetical protein GCM10010394_05100 [Streptomyces crystallinus]|uniref:Uncharacterized protein n=1 Tax=Streptomyces crystallinus TaxID=68191 RepID=A0ABN1F0Y5_9ACTN